jgi:poly-gamma-glutamate synthesis protein (capsule biosynthesis protein)
MDYPFALVKPWFLRDDLTCVNFECTLTDATGEANKQWHFKGPASYAAIFHAGGVDVVGISNNHSHDYQQRGFNDTLVNFQRSHVPVFYQNAPYITNLRGIQTCLIGDCTVVGENTTKVDGVQKRVLAEIKKYKRPDNIVIVVMHWGSELATSPFLWEQRYAHDFIDAGADAVVGHHPHIIQGIEQYHGKCIAYSLGNFAFGGNSLARRPETMILRLRFKSVQNRTMYDGCSVVPCLITSSKNRVKGNVLINNYQPIPVHKGAADRVVALVLARSTALIYGVKQIPYSR